MPGHYGDKKKKRPSKLMGGSFPTPPKPKAPNPPKAPKTPERTAKARTGSFPMRPATGTASAKAMRQATMALLKKKKKK